MSLSGTLAVVSVCLRCRPKRSILLLLTIGGASGPAFRVCPNLSAVPSKARAKLSTNRGRTPPSSRSRRSNRGKSIGSRSSCSGALKADRAFSQTLKSSLRAYPHNTYGRLTCYLSRAPPTRQHLYRFQGLLQAAVLLRLISVSRCIALLIEIPFNVPARQNVGTDLSLVGQIRACGRDFFFF